MVRYIARAILWFIFAFILFDTIKEFNRLFGLSLNPYSAIVPAVLIYVFQEFMLKRWKTHEKAAITGNSIQSITIKIFYVMVWIMVASLFLGIIIVWAAVIYKNIITG